MSEDLSRGIAIRVGVSGGDDGTMIEMTAVIPESEAEFLLNPTLDRLVLAGKRQRAKAQLPELRHERDATAAVLRENQERMIEVEATFEAETKSREQDVARVRDARGNLHNQYVREWHDGGKRGDFEARGKQKSDLDRFDQTVQNITAAQIKANEELKVTRTQLENEIRKRQSAVEILERRIGECLALARGEDISGVGESANDA